MGDVEKENKKFKKNIKTLLDSDNEMEENTPFKSKSPHFSNTEKELFQPNSSLDTKISNSIPTPLQSLPTNYGSDK